MILEKKKTLIITLLIDDTSQLFFEEKRKLYFPAHANFTGAHITLFHSLPDVNLVFDTIQNICKNINQFTLTVNKVIHNKSFNAYEIGSTNLLVLHKNLQKAFDGILSKKDLKTLHPHVTIQNKTTAYKAEKTYKLLQQNFQPFEINGLGFTCWYYSKKCWEKQGDYLFK